MPNKIDKVIVTNLYGDPSITPVKVATAITGVGKSAKGVDRKAEAGRAERDDRRRNLFRRGVELAANEPKAIRSRKKLGASPIQNQS